MAQPNQMSTEPTAQHKNESQPQAQTQLVQNQTNTQPTVSVQPTEAQNPNNQSPQNENSSQK